MMRHFLKLIFHLKVPLHGLFRWTKRPETNYTFGQKLWTWRLHEIANFPSPKSLECTAEKTRCWGNITIRLVSSSTRLVLETSCTYSNTSTRMNIFWLTTAKATDQDWFTIHLRLLRWGRFQHYLWPGYFLLQSKDSMLDTCILRWGSTYKHFYPSKSYKGNIITKTRDQNSQLFGRKKTHV